MMDDKQDADFFNTEDDDDGEPMDDGDDGIADGTFGEDDDRFAVSKPGSILEDQKVAAAVVINAAAATSSSSSSSDSSPFAALGPVIHRGGEYEAMTASAVALMIQKMMITSMMVSETDASFESKWFGLYSTMKMWLLIVAMMMIKEVCERWPVLHCSWFASLEMRMN